MSTRRQTVRSFQPSQAARFDQQFWPVFMALCITATILAATIVTLLAGFWMWVSLMILPAAIALLLVLLRFVDDRRIRRSMQLAVILSLAAHCLFLILAHETSVFRGFFLQVSRVTAPVTKQRVLHISKQVDTLPWLEENPVPSPTPEEPVPEKKSRVDTATERPQPSPVQNRTPSDNPQMVRRQQLSRTVPRLGKSPSRLSRQNDNAQPRSSEQISLAKPAKASPKTTSSKLEAGSTSLARRPSPSSAARSERAEPRTRPVRETAMARSEPARERPEVSPPQPASSQRATENPRIAESAPSQNVRAPRAASQPESARAASRPSDAARMERRTRAVENPTRSPVQRSRPSASPTAQLAQQIPQRRAERATVSQRQPVPTPSRTSTAARTPAAPENIERPRPVSRTAARTGSAELNPQPLAIEKSSGGTAGIGRTANLDRNAGTRQSPATTPSDSIRRRESTTATPNPSSLSLRQLAQVPRTAAAASLPGSTHRPDSIPIASHAASQTPAELSASSSAALTQSNADAKRSETSVDKGTGSVDLGPTRIVSETMQRRVEGGGQPQIQERPVTERMAERGDAGAAAPSIASENIERVAVDSGSSRSDALTADEPTPAAEADLVARSGGQATDSGAPTRSDDLGEASANISMAELADSQTGRAQHDSDRDEEDEEEERRRGERARQLARSSRQPAGQDRPAADSEIQRVAEGTGNRVQAAADAGVSEIATDLSGPAAARSRGGDAGRAQGESAAGANSSLAEMSDGQRAGSSSGPAPEIRGGPILRTRQAEAGVTSLAAGDTPQMVGQSQTETGLANQVTDDESIAQLDRNSPAGMALDIDAKTGPAGIGNVTSDDPGIDSRRASRNSPAIQSMTETRFRREDSGGAPSVSAAPVIAREAFRSRGQPSRSSSAPQTEEAIELGLAFLARQQQEDGSWTLHGIAESGNRNRVNRLTSDTAATGLAILAFQGAGYNHREFKYASQLQAAVKWMVEQQKDTGELYIDTDESSNNVCRLYSHGIASLALAEAYGMTLDENLRQPVQLALDYIADSQHPRLGGWRYRPGYESDTSVTGWMMMALQSGRLAGLETEEKTWLGIQRWLDLAVSDSSRHLFRYNPAAADQPETRHGRDVSPCMTAVGLLMNVYLGWDRGDPRLTDGAEYLLENLPDDSTITKRDTYYWYYATQIVRHIGGDAWETWNAALHPLLVGTQVRDGDLAGSWDPLNPVPDRWGAHAGRLYVTTMNLLSLEVDYRLLPLHDATVK